MTKKPGRSLFSPLREWPGDLEALLASGLWAVSCCLTGYSVARLLFSFDRFLVSPDRFDCSVAEHGNSICRSIGRSNALRRQKQHAITTTITLSAAKLFVVPQAPLPSSCPTFHARTVSGLGKGATLATLLIQLHAGAALYAQPMSLRVSSCSSELLLIRITLFTFRALHWSNIKAETRLLDPLARHEPINHGPI